MNRSHIGKGIYFQLVEAHFHNVMTLTKVKTIFSSPPIPLYWWLFIHQRYVDRENMAQIVIRMVSEGMEVELYVSFVFV